MFPIHLTSSLLYLQLMIIIIMGVSGSGKTTLGQQLATDLGWLYADGDSFHSTKNITKMNIGIALTDEDRSVWLTLISQYIKKHIKEKQNTIISCSALKQQYRQQLQPDSEQVKFVYLQGSQALIKQRLQSRTDHFMSDELLASQFADLEEPEHALIIDITHSPDQISAIIQQSFCLSPDKTQ